MPFLTFVTTCRGRLAQLQRSLPTLAVQADTAVVVVDYDCPERAGDWVARHHPQVTVVRAADRPRFELSRARNLGAAAAMTPWLCFIDADVGLRPDFAARVRALLQPGRYYQAKPRTIETWGTSISASADFDRAGGYDEVLQGWGKDDDDYYARLEILGVRPGTFPGELLVAQSHDDDQRVAHYDVKDRWVNESINHVYCRAKIDLSLVLRAPIPVETRRQLYEQVRTAVLDAHATGEPVEIALPFLTQETRACGPVEARLVYVLPNPRGEGKPKSGAASLIQR